LARGYYGIERMPLAFSHKPLALGHTHQLAGTHTTDGELWQLAHIQIGGSPGDLGLRIRG